jgi:hypothetical protein
LVDREVDPKGAGQGRPRRKSPAAISADISSVSAGERRDFCLLLGANCMP